MIRQGLIIAAAGIAIAIAAAGSLTPSRAQAMPLGLPADVVDQMNIVDPVALCFYIDGWNGPGMYQCGYRFRRGFGWHGHRGGGGRAVIRGGGGGRVGIRSGGGRQGGGRRGGGRR
jgi:hypothetical protein